MANANDWKVVVLTKDEMVPILTRLIQQLKLEYYEESWINDIRQRLHEIKRNKMKKESKLTSNDRTDPTGYDRAEHHADTLARRCFARNNFHLTEDDIVDAPKNTRIGVCSRCACHSQVTYRTKGTFTKFYSCVACTDNDLAE